VPPTAHWRLGYVYPGATAGISKNHVQPICGLLEDHPRGYLATAAPRGREKSGELVAQLVTSFQAAKQAA
jgi:hypothetical protein